jgi:hypothetical protein
MDYYCPDNIQEDFLSDNDYSDDEQEFSDESCTHDQSSGEQSENFDADDNGDNLSQVHNELNGQSDDDEEDDSDDESEDDDAGGGGSVATVAAVKEIFFPNSIVPINDAGNVLSRSTRYVEDYAVPQLLESTTSVTMVRAYIYSSRWSP